MKDYPKLKKISDLPEFTPPDAHKKTKKRSRFLALKVLLVFIIVAGVVGSFFSYKVLSVSSDVFVRFDDKKSSIFSTLGKLLLSNDKEILGQAEGRTNVLLLGVGGEGHTGAGLTDTIMLASIEYDKETEKEKVALVSIPRDLYVEYEKDHSSKINSVYSIGEREGENQGALLISKVVSSITGVPIHYYVRVDFEGFKKVVDALGGVDVEVERSFIDNQYPTYNFGWQTVEFGKGIQHMDGEKALQFSRSRHGVVTEGDGFEGSDFARAKRQQNVLQAVKEKSLSVNTVVNPKKINDLLSAVGDHARTSVQPWEMMILLEVARDMHKDDLINKVLEHGEDGLLVSSKSNAGAYILLPKSGNFSEIQSMVKNIFSEEGDVTDNEFTDPHIAVLNGTGIPGLAATTKINLSNKGYIVMDTGNAATTDAAQTVIYAVTQLGDASHLNSSYMRTARQLKDEFPSARVEEVVSTKDFSESALDSGVDIVIVLGKNAS